MISHERQTIYGWLIVTDTFLAGAGGGIFLISFILDVLGKYERITRVGVLVGLALVLVGTFLLLAHLGRRTRVYRLFANPSSWMSRGTLIMAAFIILGLAYSLPSYGILEWKTSGLGQGIGIAAAVFSVLVIIYPGFLFGVVKGIPFWNTGILSLLFLFLGLYTGIAAFVLTALFFPTTLEAYGFHQLGGAIIALILIQLLALGVYLEIARHTHASAVESIRLLRTPLLIGGAMIAGLLLPLVLISYSVVISDVLTLSILAGVSSVFLLAGGLLLRHGIIRAGVYVPLLYLKEVAKKKLAKKAFTLVYPPVKK